MEEKSFSKIVSQFENIPDGYPVVFISYSWDNVEHKKWVRKLSDDLRAKYAVYTLLDQYNRGGHELIAFMTQGVKRADRVLLIGTPEYKRKSELYEGGGVKYEDQLISNELYHLMGSSKFIPILRAGKFDTSFSTIVETRTGYSMVDDENYEETLRVLAADLWNDPINAAPALGPKPSFGNKQSFKRQMEVRDYQDTTVEQYVSEIKRLLSEPNSEIAFTEMIEYEGNEACKKILLKAHYNFEITEVLFKEYREYHLKAIEKLLAASLAIVRYGTLKQQELLVDTMVKLCMKPFINGEITMQGTPNLHFLAVSFLFHSIGLSCVRYGYYQILPIMMKRLVPAGHALSPSYSYPLAHLAGTNHWLPDVLNIYMAAGWRFPYSELMIRSLKPYYSDCFLNDEEFRDSFAIWERLFSLMYVYYKCGLVSMDVFPEGSFFSERIYYAARIDSSSYVHFFEEGNNDKDDWAPIKQGLFDGKYSNYETIRQKADAFFRR